MGAVALNPSHPAATGTPSEKAAARRRLLAGQVAGFIPDSGLLRAATRAGDPTLRDPKTVLEIVKSGIPGLSGQVAPRRDDLGKLVERPAGQQGVRAFLPLQSTEDTTGRAGPYRYVGSMSHEQAGTPPPPTRPHAPRSWPGSARQRAPRRPHASFWAPRARPKMPPCAPRGRG